MTSARRSAAKAKRNTGRNSNHPWITVAICAFLVAIVWLVFGQTLRHDFVNYDDDVYVYDNPRVMNGITASGLESAFTRSHGYNWHPLTTISHMLDCQIYGARSGWTSFYQRRAAQHCGSFVVLSIPANDWNALAKRICRSALCDPSAACRIGRMDRRAQRCAECCLLHAHARRLRAVCAQTDDHALRNDVGLVRLRPYVQAHAGYATVRSFAARLLAAWSVQRSSNVGQGYETRLVVESTTDRHEIDFGKVAAVRIGRRVKHHDNIDPTARHNVI